LVYPADGIDKAEAWMLKQVQHDDGDQAGFQMAGQFLAP